MQERGRKGGRTYGFWNQGAFFIYPIEAVRASTRVGNKREENEE